MQPNFRSQYFSQLRRTGRASDLQFLEGIPETRGYGHGIASRNGPPFIIVARKYESPQQAFPMIESYRSVDYVLVHYSDGTRLFQGHSGSARFVFHI